MVRVWLSSWVLKYENWMAGIWVKISGLRNNNLFKLQSVVFGRGENARMIKFVGGVRCEDGRRNFIEVARKAL